MRRRSVSQLRFAGSPGADAAAQARHLFSVSGKARQRVVELREFYLQAPFAGARAAGENVEDELGAVDYLAVERLLQIALLRGGQIVIEDDGIGR